MQCQGRTRLGRRCRNRSMEGELFCDVHMRVRHSENLAYLMPAITLIAFGYLLVFGLIYKSSIFSIFGLNFLEYAGIEDIAIQILRLGVIIFAALVALWLAYALILALIFSFVLIVRMIRNTDKSGLSFFTRIRLIGLSMLVLWFNMLIRFVSLLPSLQSRHGDRISSRRDNLTITIFKTRNEDGNLRPGQPVLNAREVFVEYLYLRSFGQHRMLMTTIVVFILSSALLLLSVNQASEFKHCFDETAVIDTDDDNVNSAIPYGSITPQSFCGFEGDNSRLLGFFMDIHEVTFTLDDGPVPLLHLATTSRFHVFYDGRNGKSLLIPKGSLAAQSHKPDEELKDSINKVEIQVAEINGRLDQSMQSILEIRTLIAATLKQNEIQSTRLSEIANKSTVSEEGVVVSHSCLQQPPIQIVAFELGSAAVDDPYLIDRLELLSQHLQEKPTQKIILAGFADKSGTSSLNNR